MKTIFVLLLAIPGMLTEKVHEAKQFDYNFQQDDYQIKFERIEVASVDKDYIKNLAIRTFKYNRTCTAFNATFILNVDLNNELEIIFQAYRFASNEYRLFPMRFEVNACKALKANFGGMLDHPRCGNFTGCPLLKARTQYLCNWTPDQSKFPPHIPNGSYMVEAQAIFRSKDIGIAKAYATVSRPEV